MKKRTQKILLIALVFIIALAACGGNGNNNNEVNLDEVPLVEDNFAVVAEGQIIPAAFVNLSFSVSGQVAEILINEGEEVKEGEVIARLRNAQYSAAVSAARLEAQNAEQALDDFLNNADVSSAVSLQAVANARDALRDAEIRLNNQNVPSSAGDIEQARARLVLAENSLDNARTFYNTHKEKPESNLQRASAVTTLERAQDGYDSALRTWNFMNGGLNEIDLAQAQADMAYAQALLTQVIQEQENLEDGLDPSELAVAEARLENALGQLAAAEATLDGSELIAPFTGTVVKVGLKIGELVGPSQVSAVVADMSKWVVETDNLTEIEIPQISAGQVVTVVPDALPEEMLTGIVEKVSDLFEEKRGDITYTARIILDENSPALRWGMTVVVTFDQP